MRATMAAMQSSSESAGLPEVNPTALHIVESFVVDVDRRLPGLLAEVYPTGSALTDDWQPANSDVDVVFVVRRPVTSADGAELTQAHAATQSVHTTGRHYVDGVYLTAAELDGGPDRVRTAPQVIDGSFHLAWPHGQLSWVTWREFSTAPRGEVTAGAVHWHSARGGFTQYAELAQFCRDNLASYWAGIADQWRSALTANQLHDDNVDADSVVWTVLGPARLVCTIANGSVVSKTESGRFAARRWPEYADLIERAVRHRAGDEQCFDVDDVRAFVALVDAVVAASQSETAFAG